ncbi:hypothetical protein [Roseovarius dicentrarchi]|uniref:hypothetical protein n=1 Tax=Roseovarius dicentrarchi TaxID=2250573 RepID=UPI0013966D09|nr:hypothetical protein [Roseovarius dicentrarchi]
MTLEDAAAHSPPSWFVAPGEMDTLAWISLGFLALALYGIITLYAAFDRWAEHRSRGTPLAKTIPTLLTIALLYEVFPIAHFSLLLPLSAILLALMADWSRFHSLGAVPVDQTAGDQDVPADQDHTAPVKDSPNV